MQLPTIAVVIIYLGAALLPALFLMRYIYRKDMIEKEPKGMLVGLVFLGVAAAVVAVILESLGIGVLSRFLVEGSPAHTIVMAFLVVAVVEEGAKFVFLLWRTWRDPNFNYRFDGIVYAVFVSLGFAAFENISYVVGYGLTTAVARALLAIPAHMGFAVFMGYFYARAKRCHDEGNAAGRRRNLWAAFFVAVLLHGFYDACALLGTLLSALLFLAFVIAMYIIVIRLVKKESKNDQPV
ncbi:MAG TPA: PrsW family glutamic-type intramembrane protease [Clostridia bacterium]|jgi:RsiW-degrading membrane proteinase PrsW (M82 family)|nr:PrsW family glutamic-type intramembrane protease [Clostridia bacterium]